jgi:hypothetical protein
VSARSFAERQAAIRAEAEHMRAIALRMRVEDAAIRKALENMRERGRRRDAGAAVHEAQRDER